MGGVKVAHMSASSFAVIWSFLLCMGHHEFLSFFLLHVSFTEHTSITPFQSEYYYFGILRSTDSMNVSMKITGGDTCCFKGGDGLLHVTNRILLEINLHLVTWIKDWRTIANPPEWKTHSTMGSWTCQPCRHNPFSCVCRAQGLVYLHANVNNPKVLDD